MRKNKLVDEVIHVLVEAGYSVSHCGGVRSCFDLLARKDDSIFVIKVLWNVEGLTAAAGAELKTVAGVVSGTPLVVGQHMKSHVLEPNVMYSRHGITVVNDESLDSLLRDDAPLIYSIRGDYCMRIDPMRLSQLRKEEGYTQKDLADKLLVSKQSVYRYEASGRISLEVADRLFTLFDEELFPKSRMNALHSMEHIRLESSSKISSFSGLKGRVYSKFQEIGLSPAMTNAPFNVVALEGTEGIDKRGKEKRKRDAKSDNKSDLFIVVSNDRRGLRQRVKVVEDISNILEGQSVCVSDRNLGSEFRSLRFKRLAEMGDIQELLEFLERV